MRTGWAMSPWSAATENSCFLSERNRMSTSRLRLQKTSALLTASARTSARSAARLSLRSPAILTSDCTTVSAAELGGSTATSLGLIRKVSARRRISGGMVAEKNMV